jgi:hypothetical protein
VLQCRTRYQVNDGVCTACRDNELFFEGRCLYNCPTGTLATPSLVCQPCSDCSTKLVLFSSAAN